MTGGSSSKGSTEPGDTGASAATPSKGSPAGGKRSRSSKRTNRSTPQTPLESEAAFQARVVKEARRHGWLCYHTLPAQRRDGRWTTPVTSAGFPDLVLVHPTRGLLIFGELKKEDGKVRPGQTEWLGALAAAGATTYLWRPSNWPTIKKVLAGP